jgi:Na+-transporting NADH:ubiquinone oxidoreductase subunit F
MQDDAQATTEAILKCGPSGDETRVDIGDNLLDAIHQAGLPISQACDGTALCGFCRVHVLEGGGNLSPMGTLERRVLASFHADDDERLACCATVQGDVSVTADYWD